MGATLRMRFVGIATAADHGDDPPPSSASVTVAVDADGGWRIASDPEGNPRMTAVDLAGDGESRTADTLAALCAALGFGEAER